MKLWLITFMFDLTQFLVEADTEQEAVELAHEHNCMLDDDFDFDSERMEGFVNYQIEPVDFPLLVEICRRNDIIFYTKEAVVFAG